MQLSLCPLAEVFKSREAIERTAWHQRCSHEGVSYNVTSITTVVIRIFLNLKGCFIHHMSILSHKKTLQVMPTPKILSDDDKMV